MASETPVSRSYFGALIDKLSAQRYGLPPERCAFTITSLRIPLPSSDIHIAADLYLPSQTPALGTILVRSPYGIAYPGSITHARVFAARGYQVLYCSCRGTATSTGTFDPGRNEADDGLAIVAWMRVQPWFSGRFATLGGSYLGYTQWALLADQPPAEMKTAVIFTGVLSFGGFAWGNGALLADMIAWADVQTRVLRKDNLLSILWALRTLSARVGAVVDAVPLMDAVERHFGGKAPGWLRGILLHSDEKGEFYRELDQSQAVEKVEMPVFLTTGWDDLLLSTVLATYKRLKGRGCAVALTVGPYTHLGCQGQNSLPEAFAWIEEHLAEKNAPPSRQEPVRAYITGHDAKWVHLPNWPPPTTPSEFYFHADRSLSSSIPSHSSTSSFTFNPHSPTPSMSHPLLFDNGPGRAANNHPLLSRPDVLTFTTSPLSSPLTIAGEPLVNLLHQPSTPHADLYILLSELSGPESAPTGRSLAEFYIRLSPRVKDFEQSGTRTFKLTHCAHTFAAGVRIALTVAGGSHPRFVRNLGTGEDSATGGPEMRKVVHEFRHEMGLETSRIVLPVWKRNE